MDASKKISFEAYNESTCLIEAVERFKKRTFSLSKRCYGMSCITTNLYKALLHRFPNTWELILVGIGFVVALICSLKPFDVCCKAILANKKKYRLDDE